MRPDLQPRRETRALWWETAQELGPLFAPLFRRTGSAANGTRVTAPERDPRQLPLPLTEAVHERG